MFSIRRNIYRFCTVVVSLVVLFMNSFSMAYPTGASASNFYYLDNDYESSSVYASVEPTDQIKIQKPKQSNEAGEDEDQDQDGTGVDNNANVDDDDSEYDGYEYGNKNEKSKKVYNTIIIRTKSSNANKQNNKSKKIQPDKAEKVMVKREEVAKPEEVEDEKNKEEKTNNNKKKKKKKATTMDKIKYYADPLRQKKPDSFYVYGMFGYTMTIPHKIIVNAAYEENELKNDAYTSIEVTGDKRFGGWGFDVGIKVYLNKNTFAFFLAPEVFYNRLFINDFTYSYETSKKGIVYSALPEDYHGTENGYSSYDVSFPIPTNVSVTPQSLFGGSLRFGFTISNFMSFYVKGNLGAIKENITANLLYDDTKINVYSNNGGAVAGRIRDSVLAEWRRDGFDEPFSVNKFIFMYGGGVGFEIHLWNQHFTIRCEYDQYIANGVVQFSDIFARSLEGYAEEAGGITNVKLENIGTKWKINNSFGILKISAGLSW